ncbi:hypothetical protein V495_02223 [Pseudogymnoascus sp. VKM F-4514 (FW-929)]|nr:hypothetical protein V495_02223 [Pseudogymnoascus sp. VKM F-4514 (FW-929)]KFY61764.1 hypothetical protein V497_02746 [Pseudogymnoascus sp. VKM F-4516 (FW-969)]
MRSALVSLLAIASLATASTLDANCPPGQVFCSFPGGAQVIYVCNALSQPVVQATCAEGLKCYEDDAANQAWCGWP